MLMHRQDEAGNRSYVDQIHDVGNTDYVSATGELVKGAPVKTVLVASKAEAEALTGYEPGTIAYTAAYKSMWQLSPTGEWVAF